MSRTFIDNTMLEMTWEEIQQEIDRDAAVLFPIAVVEEHGPHLSVSVDICISYQIALQTRELLAEEGIPSVIAPPFYWGINGTTQDFPGSFTVSRETLTAMLKDLILCMKRWGFHKIIAIPAHGEDEHILAMDDALKDVYDETGAGAYMFCLSFMADKAGVKNSPYTVIQKIDIVPSDPEEYIDNHAGRLETEPMLRYFPDHVRKEKLPGLAPTNVKYRDFERWQDPDNMRFMTPLGYLGDPRSSDPENGAVLIHGVAALMARDYLQLFNEKTEVHK